MRITIVLSLLLVWGCTSNPALVPFSNAGLMTQIPSSASGITFQNTIKADVSTKENLLDYDYFYNGAGVGIADLNNDGLVDVFFCGNQVPNKLYLNKGDLNFEDISTTAKINTNKQWSNGVTFVDVNADGWLDIYVSQGGPREPALRGNLLYINNQDLTFTESAEKYGLADQSISTQSAFFDYDKDGDLDCIVMNESTIYGIDPITLYEIMNASPQKLAECSSHLYRNDGGTFVDVTEESGLLYPSFGLGLVVSDINADGWLDIYMANDYYLPDVMYINTKSGGFKNEIKKRSDQISFYGMGADIEDLNNDGHNDIFVLDMASADHYRSKTLMASMDVRSFDMLVNQFQYPHQYMFNTLQINNGDNEFDNVAHISGIAKTDWSWAGLMTDFNMDGYKEIFVTNGYRRYALDNDFKNQVNEAKKKYQGKVPLSAKEELYYRMPSEKLNNLLFTKSGYGLKYTEVAASWGMDVPSYSNGAAIGDLDNDGDYDLVINNIDEVAHVFENQAVDRGQNYLKVTSPDGYTHFAKLTMHGGGLTQSAEMKTVRGYLSSNGPSICFGLGDATIVDSLIVQWPSGERYVQYDVDVNQTIRIAKGGKEWQPNNTQSSIFQDVSIGALKLFFKHKENDYNDFSKEILLPQKQSTLGPIISSGYFDNDDKRDVFIGGAKGQSSKVFVQDESSFSAIEQSALVRDQDYEDMGAVFFDLENDGDKDLYVISGGNEAPKNDPSYADRFYRNDNGTLVRENLAVLNGKNFSGKKVLTLDYNEDHYTDLLVLNRIMGQSYPQAAPSFIYENQNGTLVDVTGDVFPDLKTFGIVNDALVTDFDSDGDSDIIIVGEWTGIGIYENNDGSFARVSSPFTNEKGWWFSLYETDVNNDKKPDYIIGNLGGNTKFKASEEKPFKVFANDFDANGSLDIVLSNVYKDEYVPVRGRECSSQQMPFILDKFESYDEYANASIVDIYGAKVDDAYVQEVTTFSSKVMINKGGGNFEIKDLPFEAQLFPVLDIAGHDVNEDGYEDIIIAGSIYNTEVETPRYDAGSGLVLISDHVEGYIVPNKSFGINIPGNIKSMAEIEVAGETYFLFGRNNDLLKIVKMGSDSE